MFRRRACHALQDLASHRPRILTLKCPACLQPPSCWSPAAPFVAHVRGKKTKTTVQLSDLPQGSVQVDPLPADQEKNVAAYPTVVQQARRNMNKFDNCVLLTRVGGFYELYFEHADEYAPLLNLKLASKKTSAGPVSMAGFPFFQLDRYLSILVQDLNRYVALAEEFPNDAQEKINSGGLMHDRRVARIITPGTLIDENFIDPYANNYVMAIHVPPQPAPTSDDPVSLGLAWLDLSTGQFFTQQADLSSLASILSRIAPREVVLNQDFELHKDHGIFSILAEDRHLVTYTPPGSLSHVSDWDSMLESEIPQKTRESFSTDEIGAGHLVLGYVKDRLQGMSMKLQPPLRYENVQVMVIDKNSLRALEVKHTIRDGFFRGSLLHAIRRTVTKSGSRLLNEWLSAPSTSTDDITARQDLVARFLASPDLCDLVVTLLRRSHDTQRLAQKFALGRGDADDLVDLANTIQATSQIVSLLNKAVAEPSSESLECLTKRIDIQEPLTLARRITEAIDEDGVVLQHQVAESEASQMMALAEGIVAAEGSAEDAQSLPKSKKKRPTTIKEYYAEDNDAWIMKPQASPALSKLHAQLNSLLEERESLGETLRERLGAPSLTLKWTPSLGHIAHIKGKDAKNLADVRTLSSSRSTRSFHLAEWTTLGQRLDQARFHIRREEQRVFQSLREHVVVNIVKLRRNAAVLDELDIATSFARLATEQGLSRPILNNSSAHTIIGGRHPTVEGGLVDQGRSFVANDCMVGNPAAGSLWLITGPNMAGKSTFLRQNALITIMAQIGCYVPASYAELGIVDAIFSRVGSADNLYRDQSTFMVEMLETAHILKHATPKSFVIMDEIGRGTTPEDGAAVSYACLHHLVTINQCRTLFATHFHAVADLAEADGLCDPNHSPVQLYCTDIDEDADGGFVYVHRLRKGINRKSHALKAARRAGLPEPALQMAQRVLKGMDAH
ncbi:MutS2 protein [Cordyceps fumosorosea ARSEF 2679]|uniref:MutS2 protein n=1 Tax=Cordyceps fumosorosea (strain ARSEF 2679) TaxID=1081104 RepID=A0A167DYK9_CORFA|nr:MutS2 protein [Cordyceps fumosorosea ARSEF 2679]OAA43056.1 MutS2 protein [Cordyceps fumosorosea ARSEF 2679]